MLTPVLACPHCGHEHEDPWEVLEQGQIEEIRHCEQCNQPFWFALMDCERCGAEQSFTWAHRPADGTLEQLTCESCGNSYRHPDEGAAEAGPEDI